MCEVTFVMGLSPVCNTIFPFASFDNVTVPVGAPDLILFEPTIIML